MQGGKGGWGGRVSRFVILRRRGRRCWQRRVSMEKRHWCKMRRRPRKACLARPRVQKRYSIKTGIKRKLLSDESQRLLHYLMTADRNALHRDRIHPPKPSRDITAFHHQLSQSLPRTHRSPTTATLHVNVHPLRAHRFSVTSWCSVSTSLPFPSSSETQILLPTA